LLPLRAQAGLLYFLLGLRVLLLPCFLLLLGNPLHAFLDE
jgi:hypothetical protein